jgi:excisionase family DNA binding protein
LCSAEKAGTKRVPGSSNPALIWYGGRRLVMAVAVAVQSMVREVMDIRQASDYLGISGDTLYRYASEGFVPAFKLGNRWRFKKTLLDAWMEEKSGVKAPTPISVMPRQKKPVARAR